jgi:hypothetical protein
VADAFQFVIDHALDGSKVGIKRGSFIYLRPAMHKLYFDDSTKAAMVESLKVSMPDGTERWIMDIGEEL